MFVHRMFDPMSSSMHAVEMKWWIAGKHQWKGAVCRP